MKTVVMDMKQLVSWTNRHVPPGMIKAILFVGDRILCCDEAMGLDVDGEVVGVATIAPLGEENSGQPDIVGLYVRPKFRRQGYSLQLLESALARCEERGLPLPVKVVVLSGRLLDGINNRLDPVVRQKLDVRDMTSLAMFDLYARQEEGEISLVGFPRVEEIVIGSDGGEEEE